MKKTIYSYYNNLPISVRKMFLAAIIVSVFFILKSYTNHLINEYNYPFSWFFISLKIVIAYILWVVLTPIIYFLTKILQYKGTFIFKKVFLFVLGCILLAIFHQLISSRLDDTINYLNSGYFRSFFGRNNMVVLVVGSFSSFIELLVIIAVFLALDYQKKYLQNQKALITSQLDALRMQLQPHFLFNTLHSIVSMIDIDTKSAQKMLNKLGNLLRRILEYDTKQLITVKSELNFIKDYLDLEQIRYQDRVTINYNIAKETEMLKIPTMIFQPLVENAVKYGILPILDDGEIFITALLEYNAELHQESLVLRISNTYNDQNIRNKPEGTGVGLINIRKRLEQFYEHSFLFTSDFETPKLYVATMVLPIIK